MTGLPAPDGSVMRAAGVLRIGRRYAGLHGGNVGCGDFEHFPALCPRHRGGAWHRPATVEAFAAAGWRVVAGRRDLEQLEPFGRPAVHIVHLDVTDADCVRSGVAVAEAAAGGGLAYVAIHAGWALVGAIEDVDFDVARRELETNLFGAAAVLQAVLPGMLRAGGGVVVTVSTLFGRIPVPLFGM